MNEGKMYINYVSNGIDCIDFKEPFTIEYTIDKTIVGDMYVYINNYLDIIECGRTPVELINRVSYMMYTDYQELVVKDDEKTHEAKVLASRYKELFKEVIK